MTQMAKSTSITDIKAFKACRTMWDFSSSLRQNLVPNVTPEYFLRGRAVHYAVKRFVEGYSIEDCLAFFEHTYKDNYANDFIRNLDTPGLADIGNTVTLALEDFSQNEEAKQSVENGLESLPYILPWLDKHILKGKEVVEFEKMESLRVNDIMFIFTPDLILKDLKTGLYEIVDFKTCKALPGDISESLLKDQQAMAYLAACQQVYDIPVRNFTFVFLHIKNFKRPNVLKSGKLSKAKNQATNAHLYRQAVLDEGQDPADYAEIIEYYDNLTLAKAFPLHFRDETLTTFWGGLMGTMQEMIHNPLIYPNPTRQGCQICSYYDLCSTSMRGKTPVLVDHSKQGNRAWKLLTEGDKNYGD